MQTTFRLESHILLPITMSYTKTTLDELGANSRFKFKNGRKEYLINSYNQGWEVAYVTYIDPQTAKLFAVRLEKARRTEVIALNW